MNEFLRLPKAHHATTQAADGLPRLKWTLEEFERLSELGFFGGVDSERERLELVEGELLPMQSKGGRHEWVRGRILKFIMRELPDDLIAYSEPGWRPGGDLYFEPDIVVCRADHQPSTLLPTEILLLMEVADSSLDYDTGLKAKVFASLGVREYWVVNAKTLETTVHLEPGEQGYGRVAMASPSETIAPVLLPAMALSLGTLKIG